MLRRHSEELGETPGPDDVREASVAQPGLEVGRSSVELKEIAARTPAEPAPAAVSFPCQPALYRLVCRSGRIPARTELSTPFTSVRSDGKMTLVCSLARALKVWR